MSVFWRRFIVNHQQHRVQFFAGISRCQHQLFKKFRRIFLISPTSDQSDFLLKCVVRTVGYKHVCTFKSRNYYSVYKSNPNSLIVYLSSCKIYEFLYMLHIKCIFQYFQFGKKCCTSAMSTIVL